MLLSRRDALLRINECVHPVYGDMDEAAQILDDWGRQRNLDFTWVVPVQELDELIRVLEEVTAWNTAPFS